MTGTGWFTLSAVCPACRTRVDLQVIVHVFPEGGPARLIEKCLRSQGHGPMCTVGLIAAPSPLRRPPVPGYLFP